MKFNVAHVGKTGGRLGIMSLEKNATGTSVTLETPFTLAYTRVRFGTQALTTLDPNYPKCGKLV